MKILFSTTYYHPYVSGLSLYVKRLAESLAKRRHDVHVLCMGHTKMLREVGEIRGVRVVRAKPWVKMSKGFLSFDFVVQAWREVKNADVVIVNLPQFEGVIPAIFARLQGIKVIAVYHCEVVLPPDFINSVIQSLLEISNMLTLLLADHVVTYTKDFVKNSRLLGVLRSLRGPTKIQTIYPPMPKPIVRAKMVATMKKKIGKTDVIIGVAARLAAEKGLEYLFEAIPLLKFKIKNIKFKIVVVGPLEPVGEEAYKKMIMKLVAKYRTHIVFLGSLSQEHMGSFYSMLDVLVLPSVNSTESFGMVQGEAMMTGVPVVTSDIAGVRVPVQETGMGLLVAPRDTRGIARAIQTILADTSMYKKDPREILRIFSVEKTIAFYEKLL